MGNRFIKHGGARRGEAGQGLARQGKARRGNRLRDIGNAAGSIPAIPNLRKEYAAWHGVAWLGKAWPGKARQGKHEPEYVLKLLNIYRFSEDK